MQNRIDQLTAEFAPLLSHWMIANQSPSNKSDLVRVALQDETTLLAIALEKTGVSGIPTVRLLAEYFGVSAALVSQLEQELTDKQIINLPEQRLGLDGRYYNSSKFKDKRLPQLKKPLARLCAKFGTTTVAIAAIEACEPEALGGLLDAILSKINLKDS